MEVKNDQVAGYVTDVGNGEEIRYAITTDGRVYASPVMKRSDEFSPLTVRWFPSTIRPPSYDFIGFYPKPFRIAALEAQEQSEA